jgi:hypothetical protein
MKLRPDARIAVEGVHADGDLRSNWPSSSEKARTAGRAEGFDRTLPFAIDANEFSALKEAELLTLDAGLRETERAGALPAT